MQEQQLYDVNLLKYSLGHEMRIFLLESEEFIGILNFCYFDWSFKFLNYFEMRCGDYVLIPFMVQTLFLMQILNIIEKLCS